MILISEIIARVIFPNFADDSIYLDRAFKRLLNSDVVFSPDSDNFSRKFGFILSPNSESTQTTKEFTYTARTNSIGFRTKEMQPKNGDEYRIMLLGDSMFWGVGVGESDMVSTIMEKLVKHNSPKKLSVYNYSVNGYNSVQELIVAKVYLDSLKPDHIILGFFIGNDIIPNAIAFIDKEGNYSTSIEMESKIRMELRKSLGVSFNSVIFKIVALRVYIPKVRYQIAVSDDVIAKSYALLTELNSFAKNNEVRFSVAILYPRDSVQGGIVEAWSNSRKAGKLINLFCQQNSIEATNLLEYMNTLEHKNRYFFEDDGHPNKEGNFVIAKEIFNELVKPHMNQ
jgi:lysophospholipase L1-like esterase